MGIGISVLFLAVGAVLTFAVDVSVRGFNLDVVGVILMIVGAIGLLWSLLAANAMGPFGGQRQEREVVVDR